MDCFTGIFMAGSAVVKMIPGVEAGVLRFLATTGVKYRFLPFFFFLVPYHIMRMNHYVLCSPNSYLHIRLHIIVLRSSFIYQGGGRVYDVT